MRSSALPDFRERPDACPFPVMARGRTASQTATRRSTTSFPSLLKMVGSGSLLANEAAAAVREFRTGSGNEHVSDGHRGQILIERAE